jgi:hypothetical protein
MKTEIFETYEDFLKRDDKSVNGVSPKFAEKNPNYKADNKKNTGCWNCIECEGCEDCKYCKWCKDCEGCEGCDGCEGCKWCKDCDGCKCCEDRIYLTWVKK